MVPVTLPTTSKALILSTPKGKTALNIPSASNNYNERSICLSSILHVSLFFEGKFITKSPREAFSLAIQSFDTIKPMELSLFKDPTPKLLQDYGLFRG